MYHTKFKIGDVVEYLTTGEERIFGYSRYYPDRPCLICLKTKGIAVDPRSFKPINADKTNRPTYELSKSCHCKYKFIRNINNLTNDAKI